jgi:hypothetical protein
MSTEGEVERAGSLKLRTKQVLKEAKEAHERGQQYVFRYQHCDSHEELQEQHMLFRNIHHQAIKRELERGGLKIIQTPEGGQRYAFTKVQALLPKVDTESCERVSASVGMPCERAVSEEVGVEI